MSIPVRLTKLRFLAQEMQLALFLAKNTAPDHRSRNLARHVLVRAKEFIEHARQLRRPLQAAGFAVARYHAEKERYAQDFDAYVTTRDRLAAHVQDLDFVERLNRWNDIEFQKLDYFAEAARDIYTDLLGGLLIPDFPPYQALPDLKNPALTEGLNRAMAVHSTEATPEVTLDALGMTRPGVLASLSTSASHERASQLVMLGRWMDDLLALSLQLAPFPACVRILKARILTDVVSYADVLITRTNAGPLQQMPGLDQALADEGQDIAPITDFVQNFRYDANLEPLRALRNEFGGHLEIDEAVALPDIVAHIDGLSLEQALRLLRRLVAVFERMCRSIFYLRQYRTEGMRLYGVSVPIRDTYVPFDTERPRPVAVELSPATWNMADAERMLELWLLGGEAGEAASAYFLDMFHRSEVLEQISEEERVGDHFRSYTQHAFRAVHHFLLESLIQETEPRRARRTLDLLIRGRGGYPHPLSQIVVRCHAASRTAVSDEALYRALGFIVDLPDARAWEALQRGARSADAETRYQAIQASFRIFVRREGCDRFNGHGRRVYAQEVGVLLDGLPELQRLSLLLAFASHLTVGEGSWTLNSFLTERAELHQDIVSAALRLVRKGARAEVRLQLDDLLKDHDYAAICLALGGRLSDDDEDAARTLFALPLDQLEQATEHVTSLGHYVNCALCLQRFAEAVAWVQRIAVLRPERPALQLVQVAVWMEIPDGRAEAKRLLEQLREEYAFHGADQAEFNRLADKLA